MDNFFLNGVVGLVGIGLCVWALENEKKKAPNYDSFLSYVYKALIFIPYLFGAFSFDDWGTVFFHFILPPVSWGYGLFLFLGLTP